ncbi:MAG: hypothetical protein ACTSU5_15555 [Promethearchaeota archaeon]
MARLIDEERLNESEDFGRVKETNSEVPVYLERELESALPEDLHIDLAGFFPFVQLAVRDASYSATYC